MERQKLVLLILDGWGHSDHVDHNAVKLSNPVHFNKLLNNNPHILMEASGEAVGLPDGQMGNSEVGHTNIGAGRVVYQDLLKINMAVKSGELFENENICEFLTETKASSDRLHFFGLLSDGGVHSHINHLKGLIQMASDKGIQEIYVHAFMDGRDTPPQSGLGYMEDLESFLSTGEMGSVATVSGRYYAMDRDNRWDRVQKAVDTIRNGRGEKYDSGADVLKASYLDTVTDEFVLPAVVNTNGMVKDGDSVFFFNFRADRAREISRVFTEKGFNEFECSKIKNIRYMSMTEYDQSFDFSVAFPPVELNNILGEVLSRNGVNQLRIAETEKYAHVTFFFNGGREKVFDKEERELVDSPKEVSTYDQKPEMSVSGVTDVFCNLFETGEYDVVIMNFANPDMVGHTGIEEAAIKACKATDESLGRVIQSVEKMGAILLVTADHGNSEEMWDHENNQPQTAHTTNPVPFIIYNYDGKIVAETAKLADIAPTILDLLQLDIPSDMTGKSLVQ